MCLEPGARATRDWHSIGAFIRSSGAVIAVLGADGVGKSTVIRVIEPFLAADARGGLTVKHLRPGLLPPLSRLKGRRAPLAGAVLEPHGSVPSGITGSLLRIGYLLADYVLGHWVLVWPKVAKHGGVVLFDRYAYDMALDPRRFRIGLAPGLVRWLTRLVPKPDVILCLYAAVDVIRARKQELSREEIQRQVGALKEFASKEPRAVLISTEGTVEDVRDRVLAALGQLLSHKKAWNGNKDGANYEL